jgi:hypothetical protein
MKEALRDAVIMTVLVICRTLLSKSTPSPVLAAEARCA